MEKRSIAVVGSMNMDVVVSMARLPRIGETMHGEDVRYVPGGKGANQAYGLAKLQTPVTMLGKLGADAFGERILAQLQAAGVDMSRIEVTDAHPTGTAHISHTPDDNCIVVVPGANGACDAGYVERHAAAIEAAAVTVAQLEIPLAAVERAFRIAKAAGGITVLNPAPAAVLPESLLALTDYVTPNETEWALLSGGSDGLAEPSIYEDDAQLEASLRAWEQRSAAKVIVTRGAKGCSYLAGDNGGRLVTAAAPKVRVVDTTGAGDAFNAAFAHGLLAGKALRQNCAFAVAAASLAVQTFGAQDGMPQFEQLAGLMRE